MKPLNQKKRLISIFQFIGVYLLGFVLLGFVITSFQGVTGDEKIALNQRIDELEQQLAAKDSLIQADKAVWELLAQKAKDADSLAQSIENLENLLKTNVALGPAGDLTAASQRQEIQLIEREILNQFFGGLGNISEKSLQGEMRNYLNNAYRNMVAAKSSVRSLQNSISEDNTDDELQLKNAQLQNQLQQLQMDQKVGNQLKSCNDKLAEVKGEMETFSGTTGQYAGTLKEIATELERIQGEIRNFLGGDKKEKEDLDKKINDLKRLEGDLTRLATDMKAAAK